MTETYTAPDASISKWWWAEHKKSRFRYVIFFDQKHGRWIAVCSEAGERSIIVPGEFVRFLWQPLHLPEPTWPVVDPKPYLVYAMYCGETKPRWHMVIPPIRDCNRGFLQHLTQVDTEVSDPEGVELIRQAKERS